MRRPDFNGHHRAGDFRSGNLVPTDYLVLLGFAVPFSSWLFIGSTRWILKYSSTLMKVGGVLMILMGVLLFTDQMYKITIWSQGITPEWLKF